MSAALAGPFLRFAIVGLLSNAVLYLAYLGLTALGMGHKTAMSLLYVVGVLQTFLFNRRWTFRHGGRVPGSLVRYATTYLGGYLFNLAALLWLVDILRMPHAPVQGVLIFVVAGGIFLCQRYWVFPHVTAAGAGRTAPPRPA